ncbi:MAG: M3 family metallopeptidase [Bacteroidales bacterium]|nr:M3 family metallopeptidase [Bacteroidales bacterium]
MKRILIVFFAAIGFAACQQNQKQMQHSNPFLADYTTPYQIPPFESIEPGDYLPAFEQGMKEQMAEIDQITASTEPATFENTIQALEVSGQLLSKVSSVFYNLNSSLTSDTMQALARTLSPLMSKHNDDIALNAALFARIKTVYDHRNELGLNGEETMLLEKTYKRFVRGGALLNAQEQDKLRKINEELSILSLSFGENVLAETNNFKLFITDSSQLAGLPSSLRSASAEAAAKEGKQGQWLFTLHNPSIFPFLQFADDRSLREQMFKAYSNRGNHDDERDNKKIIARTAKLRYERAKLLGYASHADFILEQNMASNPQTVRDFLMGLMKPAIAKAQKEATALQEMVRHEGKNFKLEAWDWWYYTEKLRKARYDLDEELMRPYFRLENVRDGVFKTASNLYGLQFVKRDDLPKYHPDVEVYEVKEADNSHVGILYMDFFPRSSKRGGAWMSSFRKVSNVNGQHIAPIITTNFNFTAPTGDKPALLSWDETTTLFHEFGHALHGLLGSTTYNSLSGTAVPRDFVELPSQVMENWAPEPEVLAYYAFHYQTGEVIPDSLIEKMKASSTFNQGFATTEYLAAALLDLDWHTLAKDEMLDVDAFEKESRARSGINPEIISRYKSTYFSHIFSGGYSAGYYSYMWAEVLDSDAFMAFKETNLFDPETAQSFRANILSKGGTDDPMKLWLAFRGRPAAMEPLLEKRGLN